MIKQAHYITLKDQNGLTGRCCFNPHNCVLCKTFRQILRYNKFAPVQTPISWRFSFSCSSLECRRSTSSRCRSSWKASHHGSMCIWTHTHTHTHTHTDTWATWQKHRVYMIIRNQLHLSIRKDMIKYHVKCNITCLRKILTSSSNLVTHITCCWYAKRACDLLRNRDTINLVIRCCLCFRLFSAVLAKTIAHI